MRSLTLRGSSSRRFAATISASLNAVWVNAPFPLQSPNAQIPGTLVQLVIDDNVLALVDGNACVGETEVIGIWTASHRHQYVGPAHLGVASDAVNVSENLLAAPRKAN